MSLDNPSTFEKLLDHKGMVAIGVLALAVLLILAFWLGTQKGHEWADSKYLRERDENTAKIAVLESSANQHAENEAKLAVENERLKKENEAKAEILTANDAKIAGDAKKFVELEKQREQKQNEIQNTTDADTVRGLCDDAKRAGFNLSICK